MTQDTQTRWGLEALATLKREFSIDAAPGYCDSVASGEKSGPVFNWGVGVLLSAMNAAARVSPEWKLELRRFVDAIGIYWNPAGPVAGYDVLPLPKDNDRYYDDNAWMVLALVESSEVLNDPALLRQAEEALRFVLSGEDNKLGGGIYWRESDKASKNTCSNGPAIAACLAVYEQNRNPELLATARRLFNWTTRELQDPSDSLYWDSVLLDGKIDRTKWSYNTALMIRSAGELFRLTGEPRFAAEAELMAKASEAKWLVEGRFSDVGRFAHLLAESWKYAPSTSRLEGARTAMTWLYSNGKNESGLYGPRFDRAADPNQRKFELIDQASAARAFLAVK
jgi:hypothetical protein